MNTSIASKAVAIDGVNFYRAYLSLGVIEINYGKFFGFLKHKIGSVLPIIACKATINPDLCNHQLFKDMKKAGIEPVGVCSSTGKDDDMVKRWLNQFASQSNITEIIVASCDHDIIEEAIWLAEFAGERGRIVQMYTIGTEAKCSEGSCQIGKKTLASIKNCACAHFVELKEVVGKFTYRGNIH